MPSCEAAEKNKPLSVELTPVCTDFMDFFIDFFIDFCIDFLLIFHSLDNHSLEGVERYDGHYGTS